jgi:hypothetical protein
MSLRFLIWPALGVGLSFGPALRAAAPDPNKDLKSLHDQLARLERDEETTREKLSEALKAAAAHLKERETLDRSDADKVKEHNDKSQALAKRIAELNASLNETRKQERRLHDRIRLAELKARNKALEAEIEQLDARVKGVQALLKRLGEESVKDVKELEATAAEARKGVFGSTAALVDQFVGMAGNVGELSGPLKKLETALQQARGEKWKELRAAITEMRETAEFFNSREAKLFIRRAEDAKAAAGTVVRAADDPKSATKIDEVTSNLSAVGRWAVKECQDKTKIGQRIQKLLKELPLKEVEDLIGLPTLRQLGRACQALALGELAITGLAGYGELLVADGEVSRITGQVERRNALIKSFTRGGAQHKAYEHDVNRLKAARDEKTRNEAEMKEIEGRLAK